MVLTYRNSSGHYYNLLLVAPTRHRSSRRKDAPRMATGHEHSQYHLLYFTHKSTGGAFLNSLPVTSLYQRWWSCTVREMALHALSLSHPKQLTKGIWRFRSAKSSLHHPLHTDPTFNLVGSSFTISSQHFGASSPPQSVFLVSGCLSFTTPFFTAAGFFIFSALLFVFVWCRPRGFFIAGVVTISSGSPLSPKKAAFAAFGQKTCFLKKIQCVAL